VASCTTLDRKLREDNNVYGEVCLGTSTKHQPCPVYHLIPIRQNIEGCSRTREGYKAPTVSGVALIKASDAQSLMISNG
jgi:hypothetical protein